MPDIEIHRVYYSIAGVGLLPINAFVIKASEPVLIDTGMGIESEGFMEALEQILAQMRGGTDILANPMTGKRNPQHHKGGNAMEERTLVQRAYTAVVEHFVKTGRAPHYTELAGTLGLLPEEARQIQHKAAESALACWFVKDTDYIESWAPFSNVPTHYLVTIDGNQKWYGQ